MERDDAQPSMTGRQIGQYRVEGTLGRGGMGVVYKAFDTTLERSVALKVVTPERMSDPMARRRLLQEARSASALDHRNVCTIHEVGETDEGEFFVVMAFYTGSTVDDLLHRGPLPVDEALGITAQVLDALVVAHEARIVHRDIKPSNVMITGEGEVKVLDFGLAKIVEDPRTVSPDDPTRSNLTIPGSVVGTADYMSPEQCRGETVDHRSDLWSTAVMLYEMLAGQRPFRAKDTVSLLYRICEESPEPLSTPCPHAPPAIEQAVRRALEKDRARRFATAREFRDALGTCSSGSASLAATLTRAWPVLRRPADAAGESAAGRKAIVVLPFENLSPDREADYFSDGLTDELIIDLSGVKALRVISRTSAMQLKGTTKDVKTIGRELGVGYVLEGAIRRLGDSLRISARLIDASVDDTVWAEKLSGTLEDVFDIQEKISRSIVDALRVHLTSAEDHMLAEHPIDNVAAYECYLRARQEVFRFTEDGLDRALAHLEQAQEIVGENVHVLFAMGYVSWQYLNAGISTDPVHLERAEEMARKVMALDPQSAHGHRLLGLVAQRRGDTQEVVRHLKKSLEHDASSTDSLFWLCVIYAFAGHASAGAPLAARLVSIDPLTPFYRVLPGFLAAMEGRFELAAEPFRKAYAIEPGNPLIRLTHAHFLALDRRVDDAVEAFELLIQDMPETFFARLARLFQLALAGEAQRVREMLTDDIRQVGREDMQYAWNLAECHALVGDADGAVEWLTVAFEKGLWNYPLFARWDPLLERVRDDERFRRLLATIRTRWEGFEV